jgi:hypothetical protein
MTEPIPQQKIVPIAERMCAEWWLFHGMGDVPYPGDRYFWFLAEQEIRMGML